MAHYALLDDNNIVTQVVTGIDDDQESALSEHFKCTVKRTSYNTFNGKHTLGGTAFRFTFAGIGMTYDITNDVFIPTDMSYNNDESMPMKAKPLDKNGQTSNSWVRDTSNNMWKAPLDVPNDAMTVHYQWDESAYQTDDTSGWIQGTPK